MGRTWRASLAVLVAVVVLRAGAVGAQELEIRSKAAVLMDAQSGDVFYRKNEHEPLPPASVTKVMTMVLALEALRDGRVGWDDLVSTSEYAASMGGTQIWLEPGEQMSFRDLLYAVAVGSANDAAVALAEYLAGSEPAFVDQMNAKAQELGMKDTRFTNPSGLPPEVLGKSGPHVTSAYDLALLSRYAVTLPHFLEMVATYGPYTVRQGTEAAVELYSFNDLLRMYQGMDGIKTGHTNAAGYCLAATAQRDGLRLIAVTLAASTRAERQADITRLLNYGFSQYRAVAAVKQGEVLGRVPVDRGVLETVEAVAARDLFVTVPRGTAATPERQVRMDPRPAPLEAGAPVGEVRVSLEGREVGRVPVVAAEAVERAGLGRLVWRVTEKAVNALFGH
ncbi:D-alanyl-D-alanine carboxypeptidase family protein [Limnochorda pilosa]|uniref:serine-type D-Ala-D-Ala carboxypeptidase n=1 Tax=Limnochorda pilosa TaxID=1555112 RepID=A0A0K2SKA9_LIMPI|nr:D-alanyl-D-alanine carboxypeptidase family protein [Limnochorda pilosa]BAS27551.1 D-alanyl-D-alanine carboxypeptidase [Limnochorda pilosa]